MVSFIDVHREAYGVEPICQELPIAPSTYYESKAREAGRSPVPARTQRDAELRAEIKRVWEENFRVYGVRKVWRALNREGLTAARCTVARLMAAMGLRGAVRGQRSKTTLGTNEPTRPADRVNRVFKASRPNALWVADLTYVATWRGFVSTCRFATPSVWLTPGSSRRWAASGIPTTTPWPRGMSEFLCKQRRGHSVSGHSEVRPGSDPRTGLQIAPWQGSSQ